MSAIDTTAVVLALPVMMKDLHSDILSMIWVIMAYLLIITVLGMQVGKLGDMYGRMRMYNIGFAIFTVGSLFCGISQNGIEIIAFRVLQGIGGALLYSNSGAIVADTFSDKVRGKAFGYTAVGWSVGAILGILVGGTFVTFLNWRYIFFINLPIGIIATLVGYFVLREQRQIKAVTGKKVNVIDMAVLAFGLFLVLHGLTAATGSGFSSTVAGELIVGALLIITFGILEKRMSFPSLDLFMFSRRVLAASISAAFLQALASYAVLFIIIMYLQGSRGLSPFDASLLLIPGYVLGGIVGPFAGRLSDKFGARILASIGLAFQILGILIYSTLSLNTPYIFIIVGAIFNGVGASMFFPANNSAVMASTPKRAYGVASGVLRTLSNTGMVSSFAVVLFIASMSIPRQMAFTIFLGFGQISGSQLSQAFVDGMHSALLVSILLLSVALIFSIVRGKEENNRGKTRSRENGWWQLYIEGV